MTSSRAGRSWSPNEVTTTGSWPLSRRATRARRLSTSIPPIAGQNTSWRKSSFTVISSANRAYRHGGSVRRRRNEVAGLQRHLLRAPQPAVQRARSQQLVV